MSPVQSRSARFWAVTGFILALLALSAGGMAWFVSHRGWPATTAKAPTLQVIRSGSLTWRQVIVPKGFPSADQYSQSVRTGDSSIYSSIAVAQHDGATMYACQASQGNISAVTVWATHDVGANWSVITPDNLPAGTGGCRIILDNNDARTLMVSFYPIVNPPYPTPSDTWTTYASFDGGATWSKPVGLQGGVVTDTLASAQGRIYAIRENGTQKVLAVSNDHMQHWTQIDTTLPTTSPVPSPPRDVREVVAMWVNPATDEVLAQTGAHVLWSTRDAGAHWTMIPYPNAVLIGDPSGPLLTVGVPATHLYLIICGVFTPVLVNQQRIECTPDDGRTWQDRSALSDIHLGVPNLTIAGIGYDGSIIGVGFSDSKGTDFALYRLAPTVMTDNGWQRLGVIPNSREGAHYQAIPSASGFVFWALPHTATNGKIISQPNYYVATYP